jgi:hypothetical protein
MPQISKQISVIGSGEPAPAVLALAEKVGGLIAEAKAVLVCGGLGGVMEAAARGAKEKNGFTVGIVPGYDKKTANPFIDIVIATGMGHARNILVVASADVVVALPGSHGTRSEISFALLLGKKVFGMHAWGEIPGVCQLDTLDRLKLELLPIS